MDQVSFDSIIGFALQMCTFVYSITLGIKMFNSNVKLCANQLIIISIVSNLLVSILDLISSSFMLYNSHVSEASTMVTIGTVFTGIEITAFVILLDKRNHILIENNNIFILSRILLVIIFLSLPLDLIPYWIYVGNSSPGNALYYSSNLLFTISNVGNALLFITLGVYDTLSSICLLNYYNKYFFRTIKMIEHLYPQMTYRRNWIVFVTISDIIAISMVILSTVGIYPESTGYFLQLTFLFQLNTMIDFVKFDTVRHMITYNDYTISIEKDDENGSTKVC